MSEFIVKSKRLADYLIAHGCIFIRKEKDNIFVFEKNESIDNNIANYEKNTKKCMF